MDPCLCTAHSCSITVRAVSSQHPLCVGLAQGRGQPKVVPSLSRSRLGFEPWFWHGWPQGHSVLTLVLPEHPRERQRGGGQVEHTLGPCGCPLVHAEVTSTGRSLNLRWLIEAIPRRQDGGQGGLGHSLGFSKDMAPSTEQQHLLVHVGTFPIAVFQSWRTETASVRCTYIS